MFAIVICDEWGPGEQCAETINALPGNVSTGLVSFNPSTNTWICPVSYTGWIKVNCALCDVEA